MFEPPIHDGCPFCDFLADVKPCAFVTRDSQVSSFMNRSQFERGAILLVPNAHVETILDLTRDLQAAIFLEAQRIARAMTDAFGAVGLNMFQNNGIRAGQSVSHYHVHLVPRYDSSTPWRRFREEDFGHTPLDELEKIAAELRSVIGA